MSPADLERYRAYLVALIRHQVRPGEEAKLDASGVVQQTLLDAHRDAAVFARLGPEQRLAWLRVALARNLTDEYRRLFAGRRDVRREEALGAGVEASSAVLRAWVGGDTPSGEAARAELLLRLADALAGLPEAQRRAVEGHYFHGRPVAAVAAELGRTVAATAGLLKRGLRALRDVLREPEDRPDGPRP